MNTEYRYRLASNKLPKLNCPYCNARKHWQRYLDIETGEALPEQYGKCDNASKCGEQVDPYKDGYAKAIWKQEQGKKTDWKPQRPKAKKKPSNKPKRTFIPYEVFSRTRSGYEQNTFIQNLLQRVPFPFELQDIEKVISLYRLGTVQEGYCSGAITFPFIDIKNNVRTIQVKQFDEQNHTTGTDFLHSMIEKKHTRNKEPLPVWLEAYKKNKTKVSCLFGEHLLGRYPQSPIALVEAPKTAIYGTLYFGFPEQPTNMLWLAVYNLSSLNLDKCKALKGRNVYLFPDLSKEGKAFDLWSRQANDIQRQLKGSRFEVSDILERFAPEQDREQGKDIADYLIELDWRKFRKDKVKEAEPPETITSEKGENSEALEKTFFSQPEAIKTDLTVIKQPEDWGNDIAELETYFTSIELPTQPIKPNPYTSITNVSTFIKSHLATVKANNGKETFKPYLNRLRELKNLV